jgi:hypothetical protein
VGLRSARLATAFAVIALSAVAVSHGWSIVRFSWTRAGASTPASRAEAVRPWSAVPGLAGEALGASLANVADPRDSEAARRREETLSAMLSVHPLSSTGWLSLAGTRLVLREAYQKVLGALAMSSLTGANEGSLMLRRGVFGLVQWEILPPDARRRVIADLAGAVLEMSVQDIEIVPAKNVLSAKAEDTRREIADQLRAEAVPDKELARMGL